MGVIRPFLLRQSFNIEHLFVKVRLNIKCKTYALCTAFARSDHFDEHLLKPSLMQVDSGAYPRGGKLTLGA